MIDAPATPATRPALPRTPRLQSPPLLAATAALAAIVGLLQPTVPAGILRAVLVLVLVPCAVIDIDRRIIPNRITGPGAVLAIALGLALDPGGEPARLLWAGLCGGFLLLAALAYPDGMGIGDVKLVVVMGLFLGAPVFIALLLALLANSAAGIVLAVRLGIRRARKATLPFGPFLAGGALVAAVVGAGLIHA